MAAKNKTDGKKINIPPPPKQDSSKGNIKNTRIRNEVEKNFKRPLNEDTRTPLQFNCTEQQKKDFKIWCIDHDTNLTDMFFSMWKYCKEDDRFFP